MMNKGFEVIEACRLFHLPPSQVQVTVHPSPPSTRWSSSSTAPSSRRSPSPTCACPSSTPSPTPNAVLRNVRPHLRPQIPQPARLLPPRLRPFPLPPPRLRGRRVRPERLHRPQRRRRDRRGRLPRWQNPFYGNPPNHRIRTQKNHLRPSHRLYKMCLRQTAPPASWPGKSWLGSFRPVRP